MFDGEAFGAEIVEAVRGHVERATAPLLRRIEALEGKRTELAAEVAMLQARPDLAEVTDLVAKAVASLPLPPAGEAGKDADPAIIREMVAEAVAALPSARDGTDGKAGADGKDGESVTLEQVEPLIAEAVAAIPTPEAGRDGADGRDGKDADPITREQVIEAILSMPDVLDEAVRRHLEANPPEAGQDGADGQAGRDGAPGVSGKDGVGLADALIDRDNNLVLTLTDGTTKALGAVVGRDGADGNHGRDGADGRDGEAGAAGRDGFSLSDFSAELKEDGRTLILKFASGDVAETRELPIPAMIYRNVYKDGQTYAQGDTVTWAGSLWHCNEATAEKPGEGSKSWSLAAKRGRDGRDGAAGEKGEPGKPGKDGRGF